MAYKLKINPKTSEQLIIRLADGARIPVDEQNTDYKKFLVWQSEGNLVMPPDPEPEVKPKTVKEKLDLLGIDIKDLKKLLNETPGA